MKLSISCDVLKEIVDNYLNFIDKILWIKDILEEKAKILLITRPRHSGKTLHLSMLQFFSERRASLDAK